MKINKIHAIIGSLLVFVTFSCKTDTSKIFFEVSVHDSIYTKPVSGKLLFLFSKDTNATLIWGPNPFNPKPFYRIDVDNWDTKKPLLVEDFPNFWLLPIDSLKGKYAIQVILDVDTLQRNYLAKGNYYSAKEIINIDPNKLNSYHININKPSPYWEFNESELITEEQYQSSYLSDFWNTPMYIKAGIVLPTSYFKHPEKKYPVVFVFPGFASDHATVSNGKGQINRYGMNTFGNEKIFVFCNGEFWNGYHHYADSENNGPWGKAFTEEFIPYIESKYRTISNKRYLMGQSSGAWTSIWLQVNYPDLFDGAFAASPDPIDFRATGNNIYRNNANFYSSDNKNTNDVLFIKQFALMEQTINEYDQFKTWESTYGKKDKSGHYYQLFDRETGAINPKVAEQWKKYDISLIIKAKPSYYQEKLEGKLHIFVSNDDDYGLGESVRLFKKVADSLEIKTDIQFFDGLGHNVWTDELRSSIHNIIDNSQ